VKILTVAEFLDFIHITDFDSAPVFVSSRIRNTSCHAMSCPQVADGGTAFNKEGSCEYTASAITDSRLEVVLQLGVWTRC
jgi:hypothetical protein